MGLKQTFLVVDSLCTQCYSIFISVNMFVHESFNLLLFATNSMNVMMSI